MYLLSTAYAELRYFRTVKEAQYEGYAILSHVWNETEQTFSETQAISRECEATGANPRDCSSDKVRGSCLVAERYGHRWIWNDACCIDKSSSSELSEAINSMFAWYSRAEVCYAYLQDVPSYPRNSPLTLEPQTAGALTRSKWFTRGWTLQELLAPAQVVFLSQDWEVIGTKADLAELLERITMIPRSVLTLEQDLGEISVASRMSWATGRVTTRPEDEAYCLMGIFDINMPTLYGEGRKAFQRLQEEIMRRTADTTLFAWSELKVFELRDLDLIRPQNPVDADGTSRHNSRFRLFATDPNDFRASSKVNFAPDAMEVLCTGTHAHVPTYLPGGDAEVVGRPTRAERPSFTITPFGIDAHLPVIMIRGLAIAVLFAAREDEQLGLFLARRPFTTSPLYYPCVGTIAGMWPARLVSLSRILREVPECRSQLAAAPWQDICFAHRSTSASIPKRLAVTVLFSDHAAPGPYYIPSRFLVHGRPPVHLEPLPPPPRYTSPGGDAPPIAFVLSRRDVEVFFGLCTGTAGTGRAELSPSHWVNMRRPGRGRYEWDDPPTHECAQHHIEAWIDGQKTFEVNVERQVTARITLAFEPSLVHPSTTYMLAELGYERVERVQPVSTFSPYLGIAEMSVRSSGWYHSDG